MKNEIWTAKQKYMDRYDLTENQAKQKMMFFYDDKKELFVAMEFSNYHFQDKNFYLFKANNIDNFSNEPIAQIKFMKQKNDELFIRRLEFINNNYKGKGYASAFIKCFEHFAEKENCKTITGELVPLHNETEQKVKNFYLRNGFVITQNSAEPSKLCKSVEEVEKHLAQGIDIITETPFSKFNTFDDYEMEL
jgi:hypothetical protein